MSSRRIVRIPLRFRFHVSFTCLLENLDWNDACIRASVLIDSNSAKFKWRVEVEADRLYKQRFMDQLNKAKTTI